MKSVDNLQSFNSLICFLFFLKDLYLNVPSISLIVLTQFCLQYLFARGKLMTIMLNKRCVTLVGGANLYIDCRKRTFRTLNFSVPIMSCLQLLRRNFKINLLYFCIFQSVTATKRSLIQF